MQVLVGWYLFLQLHTTWYSLSALHNKPTSCCINKTVWLTGNWCVFNKCSFSLSLSFPFPRSFPSLSLCQKSTANSKSSSMLVWNILKTSTSGTPACRLKLIKLMFSDYWNSQHSELVSAMYDTIPVPTSLIFCHYFLYLFITQKRKQTDFPCLILSILTRGLCLISIGTTRHNTTIQQSGPVSVPCSAAVK